MEERRRSCARILEGPIYCRKLRAQALVLRKRAHCRTVAAAMKLRRNAQGWAARKLGKRRLSCAGFRVRHAAVFQWIALRAAITRLVCRLSCGCGGRAGAFELIGPCALIWCLAFLRCDLCDSRQHPTSKNLSTKRQQHRRRVFAKRNNSFHGDVHGARFNDASALPYTLQRRSVAASLKVERARGARRGV